jgi:hypothetical protein
MTTTKQWFNSFLSIKIELMGNRCGTCDGRPFADRGDRIISLNVTVEMSCHIIAAAARVNAALADT